jgi:hypothetical protein
MMVTLPVCMACVPAMASDLPLPRAVIPFSGTVDLKASKAVFVFGIEKPEGPGAVVVEVARRTPGRYDLKADIRHVITPLGDAAAVVSGGFEFLDGEDPLRRGISGEVSTQYTLLNYKPVRDVHLEFVVRDGRLTVDPLWFGALSGRGHVDLTGQHDVDIVLDLLSADLDEVWPVLNANGGGVLPLSGVITGSLGLKGPWGKPEVSGHFLAYRGKWKDFGYEMIDLRLEGTYPQVRLQEGKVVSSEGPSFSVSGVVDLTDLARFDSQIGLLKRELIVVDDDSGRTRAFRLNVSDGHATRLKSFTRGDADGRNEGERVIGIEKQIGF